MDKEKIESLMIDKLTIILNTSMDGQIIYGLQSPTNREIAEKLNELIDKFNYLIEVISDER